MNVRSKARVTPFPITKGSLSRTLIEHDAVIDGLLLLSYARLLKALDEYCIEDSSAEEKRVGNIASSPMQCRLTGK
jgi:hypothetical protein